MQQKISKLIATILIAIMLYASAGTVMGYAAETYMKATELERQGTSTNNANIEFDVCYNDGSHIKTLNITEELNKLHIKLNVKDAGYLENARIDLSDCNFNILEDDQKNPKIQSIDTNNKIVNLNTIVAGENIDIELNIMPNKSNRISTAMFNKDNTIKMNGKYINGKAKEINIKKDIVINTKWHGETTTNLTQNIVKYITFDENENKKLLIQSEVSMNIQNSVLPLKETNLQIRVPELNKTKPEKVLVYAKTTQATNGDRTGAKFTNNNYEYNEQTGIVTINVSNNIDENGNISWEKDSQDKYEIIMIYSSETAEAVRDNNIEVKMEVNSNNIFYNDVELNSTARISTNENLNTQKGILLDYEAGIEEEYISKGYMYNNKQTTGNKIETTYTERYTVATSYANATDGIIIKQNADTFINRNGETKGTFFEGRNYIYNKKVRVNKEEFLKILGEEGNIEIIFSSNVIASINKSNLTEDIVEIDISNANTNNIYIKTSKPKTEGNLTIEIEKAISPEIGYNKQDIQDFTHIKFSSTFYDLSLDDSKSSLLIEDTARLEETTQKASLVINKKNLSTVVKNEVELTAVLEANSADDTLYKDPTIKIELPEEVIGLDVKSVQVLYSEELQKNDVKVIEENNKKSIVITLKGNQTIYNDDVTNGINIVIYADLELSRNTASKVETINMTVNDTHADANVQFVAPTGIVTINQIKGYASNGEVVETIDNESKTIKLDTYNDKKTVNIKESIINNYSNNIKNTSILGRIPTKESTKYDLSENRGNTFNTILDSEIKISETDGKIYYSNNPSATKDLNNTSNGWTNKVADYSAVKSYLVVLNDEIEPSEEVAIEYSLNIPENLAFNNKMYSDYKVYYTNNATTGEIKENKTSAPIEATTGVGPQIEIGIISDDLKENTTITKGQWIYCIVEVKNTSDISANNIKGTLEIGENIKFVNLYEDASVNTNTGNIEFQIGSLKGGESEIIKILLEGKNVGNSIVKATVTADEYNNPIATSEYNVKVEDAEVALQINYGKDGAISVGQNAIFSVDIANLTNKDIKDLNVNVTIPEQMEYINTDVFTGDNIDFKYNESDRTLKIKTNISANERTSVMVVAKVTSYKQPTLIQANTKYNGKVYNSNNLNVQLEEAGYTLDAINLGEKYIKSGDTFSTKFTIQNNKIAELHDLKVKYTIPKDTTLVSAIIKNATEQYNFYENKEDGNYAVTEGLSNNEIYANIASLAAGETVEIIVTLKIDEMELTEDREVESYINVSGAGLEEQKSPIITYVIESSGTNNPTDPSDPSRPTDPSNPDKEEKYKITGKAWLDSNQNGKKDNDEKTLSGIKVLLLNRETGELIEGKDTETDEQGKYQFTDLKNGNYLVAFLYNEQVYSVTEYQKEGVDLSLNSDAISTDIKYEGKTVKAGLTNTLTVENANVRDIDIGLYLTPIFDLSLNKYINKVSVNNSGVTTYDYSNQNKTLTKIEIPDKQMASSTVIIEYKLVVKNEGTVPGYAKQIVDYIPEDLKFSSELNPNSYLGKDGYVYTTELANTIINPGESKEIKLILTKQMTSENTGTVNNTAEIAQAYNTLGLNDINSTPGNKNQKENDLGTANTIISVKTGQYVIYTTLTLTVIAVFALGVFAIKKYVIKGREN